MSKILVCGSEGSLGQALIPFLLNQKHAVYGADNLMRYSGRLGLAGNSYEFRKVDLTDRLSVDALVKSIKPDYIFQFAARIYGVGGFNSYCADILGEDITLHNNVLKAAVNNSVERVIYSSSSMVYESCPQELDRPVEEWIVDTYPAPKTEYGLSKFVGERMCEAFRKQYGLNYTIWRPFNIITPFERSDENVIGISHVFSDYIHNIVTARLNPLPILGSGEQIRCFTWIDDVAEAISKFSFDDATVNSTFNLGNKEPVTMKELAIKIKNAAVNFKVFPDYKMEFKTVGSHKYDVNVRIPDVSKARDVLGWEARMKIDDSIKLCVAHALDG